MNADDAAHMGDESRVSNHAPYSNTIVNDIPAAVNNIAAPEADAEADEGAATTVDQPEVSLVSATNMLNFLYYLPSMSYTPIFMYIDRILNP